MSNLHRVIFSYFQSCQAIPQHLKDLYKTTWEISQKQIINMAADRGAFIDQSQSLNIHMANPNYGKISSMHFYAWKKVRLGFPSPIMCSSCLLFHPSFI